MLRILIIDDEAAAGNILKLLIEKFISSEKEICYCNEPEKALDVIKTFKPTLIMLDIGACVRFHITLRWPFEPRSRAGRNPHAVRAQAVGVEQT